MSDELKTCPICKQDKLVKASYYVRRGRPRADGAPSFQHGCKDCRKRLTTEWQAAHPERKRSIARLASLRYYRKHKDLVRLRDRKRYDANPEAAKAAWRARYAKRKAAKPQPEAV